MEEKIFDYEDYIQQRLKEIDGLDERKYAKELLLDGLGKFFGQMEPDMSSGGARIKRT